MLLPFALQNLLIQPFNLSGEHDGKPSPEGESAADYYLMPKQGAVVFLAIDSTSPLVAKKIDRYDMRTTSVLLCQATSKEVDAARIKISKRRNFFFLGEESDGSEDEAPTSDAAAKAKAAAVAKAKAAAAAKAKAAAAAKAKAAAAAKAKAKAAKNKAAAAAKPKAKAAAAAKAKTAKAKAAKAKTAKAKDAKAKTAKAKADKCAAGGSESASEEEFEADATPNKEPKKKNKTKKKKRKTPRKKKRKPEQEAVKASGDSVPSERKKRRKHKIVGKKLLDVVSSDSKSDSKHEPTRFTHKALLESFEDPRSTLFNESLQAELKKNPELLELTPEDGAMDPPDILFSSRRKG